jgi:betaine-aldehyde dehydrogenase
MADQSFKHVVNGELVDSASGETYDVIDPTTGEVYARAPMSGTAEINAVESKHRPVSTRWSRSRSDRLETSQERAGTE